MFHSNLYSGVPKVAIIKETIQVQMNELNEYSPVTFICPVCKSKKELKITASAFQQQRGGEAWQPRLVFFGDHGQDPFHPVPWWMANGQRPGLFGAGK